MPQQQAAYPNSYMPPFAAVAFPATPAPLTLTLSQGGQALVVNRQASDTMVTTSGTWLRCKVSAATDNGHDPHFSRMDVYRIIGATPAGPVKRQRSQASDDNSSGKARGGMINDVSICSDIPLSLVGLEGETAVKTPRLIPPVRPPAPPPKEVVEEGEIEEGEIEG